MRLFVESIDEVAHTADLRCDNCDYTAAGINLLTYAQVAFVEEVENLILNGNVSGSVDNSGDLPDPDGKDVDTIYHVLLDDNNVVPDGGANLYRVVEDSGHKWVQINSSIVVTCPTCTLQTTYPSYDPRNVCGVSLGRAKIS